MQDLRVLCFGIVLFLWPVVVRADAPRAEAPGPDTMVVVGEGMAALGDDPTAAEDEAVWEAKRNAVEQAAGIFLRARTLGHNSVMEEDEIRSRSDGFVQKWELVPGSRQIQTLDNHKVLRLQVRATVALLPVLRRLTDMADVYNDLERPRVRVEMQGDDPEHRVQEALTTALKAQGYDVATGDPAEIVLAGRLELQPTLHLGDHQSPLGVGETVAACRARLATQIVSNTSQEILLSARVEAAGQSFVSDAAAAADAADSAVSALLAQNEGLFLQQLLVRWVHERQEGYVAVLQVTGLDAHRRALLRQQIAQMRGFRQMVSETTTKNRTELRFLTLLSAPALRQRLASLHLEDATLSVSSRPGAFITCSARRR